MFPLIIIGIVLFLLTTAVITHKVTRNREIETQDTDILETRFRSYSSYDSNLGSRAAYWVADAFRDIPNQYRPFSSNELARTLIALDLKWGERADRHGHRIQYFEEDFNDWFWTCECQRKWKAKDSKHNCQLWDDYGRLVWEFHEITEAAKEQERQFHLSGLVEADPEHLERLLTRARAESEIITSITHELMGTTPEAEHTSRVLELKTVAQKIRAELVNR